MLTQAFVQRELIEGEDWEEMYESYKEMSRAGECKEAAGWPRRQKLCGS